MICEHLRPLEERILLRGFVESSRGQPWPKNCREWVTYNCDVRLIARLEGVSLPPCVKHYEFSDIHFGSETGLTCEQCHDALISGVLNGPAAAAFAGMESIASPDGSLEAAYLVWGGDRGPDYRAPRIIHIATGEVLMDLWQTSWSGHVQFEDDGGITLTLSCYPEDIRIHIDAHSRTFAFEKSIDRREPLASLAARLEPFVQQPSINYHAGVAKQSRTRQFLSAVFFLLASLVFVASGLWIIVDKKANASKWAGWGCVIFFGLCGIAAVNDLRKISRRDPH